MALKKSKNSAFIFFLQQWTCTMKNYKYPVIIFCANNQTARPLELLLTSLYCCSSFFSPSSSPCQLVCGCSSSIKKKVFIYVPLCMHQCLFILGFHSIWLTFMRMSANELNCLLNKLVGFMRRNCGYVMYSRQSTLDLI